VKISGNAWLRKLHLQYIYEGCGFLLALQSFWKETFIDKKDEGMRSRQGGIQFDYGTLERTYLIEGADWF